MTIKHTDPEMVGDVRVGDAPTYGHNPSGYGSKIPTPFQLRYGDQRWHRVYVMVYSNAGTAYIVHGGERLVLDYGTEHRLEGIPR